jgi:hypothetical protein
MIDINNVLDIEGNKIDVGDVVYYARKDPYSAKGLLVKVSVTDITINAVYMGSYRATMPSTQIIIRKKVRIKKLKRVIDENI